MDPDPSYLFLGAGHATGLNMLHYGLLNRAGIIVLTGDIGAGKTTLVRHVLQDVGNDVLPGLISNTHRSFGDLMQWVASAFGLPPGTRSMATSYDRFEQFLVEQHEIGKRPILVVDEAQNLDEEMLEELRLLTNINAGTDVLLQLILVGQPELREKLRAPALAQFAQRIGVDFHLLPLRKNETARYIDHRLAKAGGKTGLFEPVACRFIHHQTGGIPRLVNAMCDTALVYGYAEGRARISAELVYEMAAERLAAGLFGAGVATFDLAGSEVAIEHAAENMRRARAEIDQECRLARRNRGS